MHFAQPVRLRALTVSLLLAAGLFQPRIARAQTVSDYQVKAAYLYNFAKFIEWPARRFTTPTEPIRFCVLNDRAFEVELSQIVGGKSIAGRAVDVTGIQDGGQSIGCHVLFIDAAWERQTRQIVDVLRGTGVLTVGEGEDFLTDGGIISFVLQDDRVQFEINRKAANDAGLYVSSRLLGVAKRVLE